MITYITVSISSKTFEMLPTERVITVSVNDHYVLR